MPNYRALHFDHETAVQGWDGLCWMTLRTFTGEDHKARGSALVVSLEADLEESRTLAAQEGGRAETDGLRHADENPHAPWPIEPLCCSFHYPVTG